MIFQSLTFHHVPRMRCRRFVYHSLRVFLVQNLFAPIREVLVTLIDCQVNSLIFAKFYFPEKPKLSIFGFLSSLFYPWYFPTVVRIQVMLTITLCLTLFPKSTSNFMFFLTNVINFSWVRHFSQRRSGSAVSFTLKISIDCGDLNDNQADCAILFTINPACVLIVILGANCFFFQNGQCIGRVYNTNVN